MAIDTINEKLAIMEFGQVWEPGLPRSPGTLGADDRQQLLYGFPGVLWAAAVALAPGNLSDCMFTALIAAGAAPGHVNNMQLRWLKDTLLVTGDTLQECWYNFFVSEGVTSGQLQDMAMDWLILQGHTTGSLYDRWRAYWCS